MANDGRVHLLKDMDDDGRVHLLKVMANDGRVHLKLWPMMVEYTY